MPPPSTSALRTVHHDAGPRGRVAVIVGCASLVVLIGCDARPAPVDAVRPVRAELAPSPPAPTRRRRVLVPSPTKPPVQLARAAPAELLRARRETPSWPSSFAAAPFLVAAGSRSPVVLRADDDDPTRGEKDAPVTAIVFGDVQCPATAKAVRALEAVQARVGNDRLRIAWKSYPLDFHERARPVAEAAAAAQILSGPASAFAVLDAALAGMVDDAELEDVARAAGVPMETYRFLLAESRESVASKVDADIALAESAGIRAVPHVVIGDRAFRGAATESDYAAAFDGALVAGRR